jgi:ATP-dependent DNA helicase RecG
MNTNISKLLEEGEGISVEFKKAISELPSNFFETVCAFLNRNGGTIILGITDAKIIEGVNSNSVDMICKNIANLSNNPQKLFPSFLIEPEIFEYEGKMLIHAFVPISSQVHRCNGRVFDRSTDGDFELKTDAQIKNLYTRKNLLYSENTVYPYLFETDFVPGIVERVRKIIRINRATHPWNELSNEEFYRSAGLYRKDIASGIEGFTMTALLMFGKEETIQSAIPHYKTDALLRKVDLDRYDDRENIRCNLIDAYDRLMNFTAKHLPDKFYMEGDQRISLREKIFREIIANMLIHREYTNAFPSTFTIYNNYVETKNANKPHVYGILHPNTFQSFPKNPNIAQLFTQMGRSEELGTGIRNVYKYSKAYSGSDKIVFSEEDIFISKVPLKSSDLESGELNGGLSGGLNDGLNEGQQKVFQLIQGNEGIKVKDISFKLNMPIDTIDKHIRVLIKMNLIERRGSRKTGGYFLKINMINN